MDFSGDHRCGPRTDRLILRAYQETDAEAFYHLNSHPEVIRYTGEPPCPSVEAAHESILAYPDWQTFGIGRWATVYRATQQVMGFAGLKYLPEFDAVDLGYRFLPEYWGMGLATEASKACLAYGFDILELERVVAFTMPENAASIRVLEKTGFVRHDPVLYDGDPAEYFVLEQSDYRRHSAS